MSRMDHARFEELKDAFVLGALPDEERREFEEYLAAHPERQAEIEKLGTVVSLLALSPTNASRPLSLSEGSWKQWERKRTVRTRAAGPSLPGSGSS